MKARLLLGTTVLMALVIVGALVVHQRSRHWWQHASVQQLVEPVPKSVLPQGPTRPVYPYSVIPGGAYSSKEVSGYVAVDPVVRNHYQGIRVEALRPSRLSQPMLAYLSYRKGDRVAWTGHKLPLPKGEIVLTDGQNLIRARCGNRIRTLPPPLASEVLSGEEEPSSVLFETPLPEALSTTGVAPTPVTLAQLQPPPAPPATPTIHTTPTIPPTTPGTPTGPFTPACTGDNCSTPTCTGNNCSTPTCTGDNCSTPTCTGDNCSTPSCTGDNCNAVPEPSSFLLLASGLGAVICWRRKSLR